MAHGGLAVFGAPDIYTSKGSLANAISPARRPGASYFSEFFLSSHTPFNTGVVSIFAVSMNMQSNTVRLKVENSHSGSNVLEQTLKAGETLELNDQKFTIILGFRQIVSAASEFIKNAPLFAEFEFASALSQHIVMIRRLIFDFKLTTSNMVTLDLGLMGHRMSDFNLMYEKPTHVRIEQDRVRIWDGLQRSNVFSLTYDGVYDSVPIVRVESL